MSFENIKASIALLLDQMTEKPEDEHQLQEQLREKLAELKALGQPLPQDFVDLERLLDQRLEQRHKHAGS